MNQQSLSSFIWAVADLLRGDYKQSEYGKVILPFTVLRRLHCVLEPTKEAVLAEQTAGSACQMEMAGNLAHRPVFGPVQAMNRVDLFRGQHDSAATV